MPGAWSLDGTWTCISVPASIRLEADDRYSGAKCVPKPSSVMPEREQLSQDYEAEYLHGSRGPIDVTATATFLIVPVNVLSPFA